MKVLLLLGLAVLFLGVFLGFELEVEEAEKFAVEEARISTSSMFPARRVNSGNEAPDVAPKGVNLTKILKNKKKNKKEKEKYKACIIIQERKAYHLLKIIFELNH